MPSDVATAIVIKDELLQLADWERKYAEAKKKVTAAEKELAFRRQGLAEKVLGVKSSAELKELSPEKVQRLYAKRLERGDWEPGKGAPAFAFTKTNEGRYPSWSALYIEEMGETAAAKVRTETPITYSYAVEVSVPGF
jgi:hypothetical protein